MKQHKREFFVYMLRSGKIKLDYKNIVVHPFKIDDIIESYEVYDQSLDRCYRDGLMDQDEMTAWMKIQGIWTKLEENLVEKMQKDIETLKVRAYRSRLDKKTLRGIKMTLRVLEDKLIKHHMIKTNYFHNTVEGVSDTKRISWLISRSCYIDDRLCYQDEDNSDIAQIVNSWNRYTLSDTQLRDIARNEPWRSTWMTRESVKRSLFLNPENTELSSSQKGLVVWSQTYDNVRESPDCPPDDVIADDDMMDGWFILENEKREKEAKEQANEGVISNQRISNSQEVMIVANNTNHAQSIYESNNSQSRNVIKDRSKKIQEKGQVEQIDFVDERLKLMEEQRKQRQQ
tara:strand:+ start:60 stop:1091 length:1032 start_codon:yes stop_codon:yes gene_type:complete